MPKVPAVVSIGKIDFPDLEWNTESKKKAMACSKYFPALLVGTLLGAVVGAFGAPVMISKAAAEGELKDKLSGRWERSHDEGSRSTKIDNDIVDDSVAMLSTRRAAAMLGCIVCAPLISVLGAVAVPALLIFAAGVRVADIGQVKK